MNQALEKELREHLDRLEPGQQRRVVDFARDLAGAESRGTSGSQLTRFAGSIGRDDVTAMELAIEAGCEHVNPDEW